MISLLLLVFLIQLAIYIVNSVGANAINELAWQASARLPLASSRDAKEQLRLRREVLRLKRDMNAISAQDDFAKWARIRREHDKTLAAYDKKAAEVSSHRASFDTKVTVVRWTLTSGFRLFLQFWHSKSAIFVLPLGWFPWPVEWILGFPRCKVKGGVSINVWSTCCAIVIGLVGDLIIGSVGSKVTAKDGSEKEKVAMGVGREQKSR